MNRSSVSALLLALLPVSAALGQARFDPATQVLSVPQIDVAGQVYRDLAARLDPDGRLTILALRPPANPAGPDLNSRIAAASQAAQADPLCSALRPFYWEVGDAGQRLAGGSVGALAPDASTVLPIASASKWLYAAYVVERRAGLLSAEDIQFLNFRSGYTEFPPTACNAQDTVASCLARDNHGVKVPAHEGKFHYGGGHMQKHASLPGMGLGALDNAGLATELRRLLGNEIGLSFGQPQPPGGVRMAARDYAAFLRKLLTGQLRLGALLGSSAVCTNPATCSSALYSPIPASLSWHYSLGHWVEDDPTGDSAFSSAGAFGFYPWIDARKSFYGIVARVDLAGAGDDSAACGAAIRRAWDQGRIASARRR